jgi:hypothetical protein
MTVAHPRTQPASSAEPRREQRRRHSRFDCDDDTFGLVLASPDTPLELAGVRNISQSGAGLIFGRRLHPGRVVVSNLFNARRNFACRVAMRVVYANAWPDGIFHLGGIFIQELSLAEVEWLRSREASTPP